MHIFRFSLVAFAAAALAATPGAGNAADPYELFAILPLTGGAAFLGSSEVRTMRVIEAQTNAAGGIAGRPLKITVLDDQTNPQVSVQLVNQLAAKRVPAFVGPGISATCAAAAPIITSSGPVGYCLSPAIHPPAGSYQFSASVGTADLAAILVRYFKARGWNRVALITSTDTTGQDFDGQMDRLLQLPEFHDVALVAHEHFNTGDVSASAQIVRIQSARPQALIAWTTGTPLGTVLHGIRDNGLDIPIATSNSNMSYAQMQQYGDILPKTLYFPGMRALTRDDTGPGPIREKQTAYFAGFTAIGSKPDFGNNLSWDPTMIVVSALRALGPDATAKQVRDWVESLHGWVGINGIYDFRAGDQRGIGQNAAVVYAWDAAKHDFAAASRGAGRLR